MVGTSEDDFANLHSILGFRTVYCQQMTSLETLSDPVRLRIVRHLEAHPGASVDELADAAGVHPNTVRPHLTALQAAGAVVRASGGAVGRGRPRTRYRLAPGWTLPTADFLGLAEVLAAVLVRTGADAQQIHAVGEEWGRFLLGRPGDHDLDDELARALEQLGFSARLAGDTLELSSCPCSLVLPGRPELICELAVAVADGVLAGAGSDLRVTSRAHHPDVRACSARLSVA